MSVKPPTRFGPFSKIPLGLRPLGILLNDPLQAGGLTANIHLI